MSSQPAEERSTPPVTRLTNTSPPSCVSFVVEVKVLLTEEQHAWLRAEVERRRGYGQTSPIVAARGANRNVNMGMLVREALELQHNITS